MANPQLIKLSRINQPTAQDITELKELFRRLKAEHEAAKKNYRLRLEETHDEPEGKAEERESKERRLKVIEKRLKSFADYLHRGLAMLK
jgi:hypothetical protein